MHFVRSTLAMLKALLWLLVIIPCKRLFGPGAIERIRQAHRDHEDEETGQSISGRTKRPDEVLPLERPHDEGHVVELPGASYRLRYDRVSNIIYTPIKNKDTHE